MIPVETTFPSATNILIVYIAIRINCQLNVYQVINDTIWKHLTMSYQYSYSLHHCAYERSVQCISSQKWYPLKPPFHQLTILFHCILFHTDILLHCHLNDYRVTNDTIWKHLSTSYQYSYSLHRYADERSVQYIPGHKWYLLKPHFYQLPRLLCFTLLWVWKVSWMYPKL